MGCFLKPLIDLDLILLLLDCMQMVSVAKESIKYSFFKINYEKLKGMFHIKFLRITC